MKKLQNKRASKECGFERLVKRLVAESKRKSQVKDLKLLIRKVKSGELILGSWDGLSALAVPPALKRIEQRLDDLLEKAGPQGRGLSRDELDGFSFLSQLYHSMLSSLRPFLQRTTSHGTPCTPKGDSPE